MTEPTHPHDPAAALPAEARDLLAGFRDLLLHWNQLFNLTAIRDRTGIDRHLIGDALLMLPAIDELALEGGRLIDVGSGAGLPGIVLKIARPHLTVTLLEATGKKVEFIRRAIDELGLTGVTAIHGRAEEVARLSPHREVYDLATARAVASLPALLELCMPFVRVGGFGLFPKGVGIEDELAADGNAAPVLGCRLLRQDALAAPDGGSMTQLVIAAKIGATPDKYPRRSGIPATQPLGRRPG
ncbi:MAG: 16S rRNA (guanine(527)-N(7))-methyltransferase RsmG [Thermomicrobiales bacterium]